MSGKIRSSDIFVPIIFSLAVLSSLTFLTITTYETVRYGPRQGSLGLQISSLTLAKTYVGSSQNLVVTWNATLNIVNRQPNLNVTILPFHSFLTYNGLPISCGHMMDRFSIGVHQKRTFEIRGTSRGCEWARLFTLTPHFKSLKMDLLKGRVTMGVQLSVVAYFRHGWWGWDVRLKPYCQDLETEVESRSGQAIFNAVRTANCVVPQPLWYH